MKRQIVTTLMIVTLLSACAPSESAIQTAMAQTQATYTPTPEPTPIPLTDIDISEILVVQGDLPAGVSAAQLRDIAPKMYNNLPNPDKTTFLEFERDDKASGGVVVFLYKDDARRLDAYDLIVEDMGNDYTKQVTDVGEQAFGFAVDFKSPLSGKSILKAAEIVFVRCAVVVHVRFAGTDDINTAIAYGKRLDKRLAPLFCRE